MKLPNKLFGIILVLFLVNIGYPQMGFQQNNKIVKISGVDKKSIYELKIEIMDNLKKQINSNPPASPQLEEKDVYLILGISSFAAFVLSFTVFKQEIFSALPLAFFGAGVLFTILAN